MPCLSCHNLSLGYEGKTVLSGVSFSVNPGDYLCIVGENGSGKSTLMKALLKLKAPMAGQIAIDGRLAKGAIGYLPQQMAARKDFPASVREVVRSGCLNRRGWRPYYNGQEKRLAENAMEKLGIAHLAKHCFRDLSGGQERRALLARALCAAGSILLLDEPTAGLDPKAEADMYALIQALNKGGLTIIMISHDIAVATQYASHFLHLAVGGPLFFGTTADYVASEAGRAYASLGGGRS